MISLCPFIFNIQFMNEWSQSFLAIVLVALIVGGLACEDDSCVTCDTYISSSGTIIQTCSECSSGYKLNGDVCEKDNGLIIGIAIGAFFAVVAQIVCYIICKIKFGGADKKRADLSLDDIYKIQSEQDGEKGANADVASESMKTEYQVYVTHKCGTCDQVNTSIKTQCGHYFHHACFKEGMQKNHNLCPRCDNRAFSPVKLLCCKCLNKIRSIPIDTITKFQNFHQYICFNCKFKARKEEEANKCWKKCCTCC